ncbi:hypothetical protein FIBSPDRAFT_921823 [Athelia psychrophila]|uniref:HNH nuclease domain-containing protein n=1 Tax=Athelia psychrophila TaxID=1759441 RepID=A0A166BEJ1_9AGAM|nr:hypothetical protein FIBSPDRAFT_921823 [Fibularhizoctonia sp. CBS 109695]
MYARLLGYLVLESPGDEGRDYITDEIIRCDSDNDRMNCLAKLYQDHLLRLFRQNKGHTPTTTPSYDPSLPSVEEEKFLYSSAVEPAPNDHTQAKKAALRRDDYRCVVTGALDCDYIECLSPTDQAALPITVTIRLTNACHIFPPFTNVDIEPEEEGHPTTHYAGTVWGIVNHFGGVWIENELNGNQLHRLSNVMTMTTDLRTWFDELRLWFEEVPNTPATYTVGATRLGYLMGVLPVVTFSTMDPALALPDKRYLKLHAVVCRVAWMSGATKHMDKYDAEHEGETVLAHDGSSAEFLTTKLQRVLLGA